MKRKTLDPLQMVCSGVYEGFGFQLTRGQCDKRWYLKQNGELVANGFQVKGDGQEWVRRWLDKNQPNWKDKLKPKYDKEKEKQRMRDRRAAEKAL